MTPEAHVSDKKKAVVKQLSEKLLKSPIIASINMKSLPTSQLQQMRGKLRGIADIVMTKRRLMKIAIENIKDKKPGIEKLIPELKGMPALMLTDQNPFRLCKLLDQNKTPAPAKPGQIAPKDIEVKKGSTGMAPGPIISELGSVGLKTGVEDGKVAVKEDKVIVKEGETISKKVADVLTKLKIEPMEIGLNLTAVYEDGNIMSRKDVTIDEQEYMDNFTAAASESINLAVEIAYPIKELVEQLLSKAFNEAKILALEQKIISDVVIENMISQAENSAKSLQSKVPEAKAEEPSKESEIPEKLETPEESQTKEEAKEEKPAEAPKEEKAPAEEKKQEPQAEEKKEEPKQEEKPEIPSAEELVKKTKEFAEGKKAPTADELLEEPEK